MTSKLDSTNTESFDDGVPVALEDRAPGELRGAGARSPLFWKTMLVAMALMWGFSFCMMKDVLDALPPYLLLACRFLIAALIMLALFFRRIRAHFNRTYIVAGLLMGTSLWAAYVLQTVGLVNTTAGKSAFLTGTYCVLVPFIGHAVMGEKLTRYNLGAAFLCLVGIAFVALDSLTVGKGDLLTLAGAVFFAIEIVIAAKFVRNLDVNAITFWMFLVVALLCVAGWLFTEQTPPLATFTPPLVGTVLFLAVICTCVGMLVQNLGLAHVPSSTGSLLLSLESPSGVLFSVLLGGEVLTGRLLFGFALIFLSVVLSETHFAFLRRK